MNEVCEVTIDENQEEALDKNSERKSRKTSELWNYFTAVSREHAICDLCQQKFSYKTSTSNLRKHIQCKHKDKALNGDVNRSKQGNETSSQNGNEDISSRLTIKRENGKKSDSPRKNISAFLNFKNTSWDPKKEMDEYDAFGVTVAAKLRKMEERQRLFCERIINDALFKGAFEQLTPLSDIVICISTAPS